MPANSRVGRCVRKLKAQGKGKSSYPICVASTGQAYPSGKTIKKKHSESFDFRLTRALESVLAEAWTAKFDVDVKEIFPEMPDGKTVKITHKAAIITFTNELGKQVVFKLTKKGTMFEAVFTFAS